LRSEIALLKRFTLLNTVFVPGADYWIKKLNLTKHIEGGSFRETYRATLTLDQRLLPQTFKGGRAASTAIYFMLEKGQFSAFHRIASDEIWHFYDGDPLDIYEIDEYGALNTYKLGRNPETGESYQVIIRAGVWFGSRVAGFGAYSLVGCTVAPGFDFADFELANREELILAFPGHKALITAMTYDPGPPHKIA
jgi:uncharacterized protein